MAAVFLLDIASCKQLIRLDKLDSSALFPLPLADWSEFVKHLLKQDCYWAAERVLQAIFHLRSSEDSIEPLLASIAWFAGNDHQGATEQELRAKVSIVQTFYEGRSREVGAPICQAELLDQNLEGLLDDAASRDKDDAGDWKYPRSYLRQKLILLDRKDDKYSLADGHFDDLHHLLIVATSNEDFRSASRIQGTTRVMIHNKTHVKLHVRLKGGHYKNNLEPSTFGSLTCDDSGHQKLEIAFGVEQSCFKPDSPFSRDRKSRSPQPTGVPRTSRPTEAAQRPWPDRIKPTAIGAMRLFGPLTGSLIGLGTVAANIYDIYNTESGPVLPQHPDRARKDENSTTESDYPRLPYRLSGDENSIFKSMIHLSKDKTMFLTSAPHPTSALDNRVKWQMRAIEVVLKGGDNLILCGEEITIFKPITFFEIVGGPVVSKDKMADGRKFTELKFGDTEAIRILQVEPPTEAREDR